MRQSNSSTNAMKRPERVLALGFAGLISLGTVMLALPAAAADGRSIGLTNSLFTATSAVCVTGLVVLDTGAAFSLFGQGILLCLIQAGGVGFMVIGTVAATLMGRRITLWERQLIRETLNTVTLGGVVRLARRYGLLAVLAEGAGALLLALRFVPQYGLGRGVWYAVFHAVSAFCNAGFDLFGGYASLTAYREDPLVLLVICGLIIIGGLGFSVLAELTVRRNRRLSLQARMVLWMTAILLASSTAWYALLEWNNVSTLAKEYASPPERILNAFFQAVTVRTAGFNTIDVSAMTDAAKAISVLMMFIGASPASTGGGIKTTTVAAVAMLTCSVVRGGDAQWLGRRVTQRTISRAVAIMSVGAAIHVAGMVALTVVEGERVAFIDIMMEAASALNTVGISSAGTRTMAPAARMLLIPMMYLGRVGPLTLTCALARRANSEPSIRRPMESVMIG